MEKLEKWRIGEMENWSRETRRGQEMITLGIVTEISPI